MVTTIHIDGMRTVHCARAVFTSLARVEGITGADVVVGKATLEHEHPLDVSLLVAAVQAVGYAVREARTDRRRLALLPDDGPPDMGRGGA